MKKNNLIYLDHAATTPVSKEVIKAMQPFFGIDYGNPSALYQSGVKANKALSDARRSVADMLRTQPDTITFTSGGTESDNLAIFGVARATPPFQGGARGGLPSMPAATPPHLPLERGGNHQKHLISIGIEHHAVLEPLERLKVEGWSITYIPVSKTGLVSPSEVIKAIQPGTVLISVMYANNEVGTIQPIADIGRALLRYRKEKNTIFPYFHTDACQAAGYLDLDVEKLHVDLMTLNSGKIYGPKGVGCLYVRRGVKIEPQILGGSQEHGLRAGTENIAGIVGFAKALELAQNKKQKEQIRLAKLSTYFINKLVTSRLVASNSLNGPAVGENRLANNVNVTFPGVDAEALLLYLDSFGICCSTGSACTATTAEPSHVLRALGLSESDIRSTMRFSFGLFTTKQQLDFVVTAIQKSLRLLKQA